MGVVGQVVTFANTTVKPIIEQIFGFITQTVVPILLQTFTAAAPAISGIISGLGTAIMAGMQIIGTAIQLVLPIIEWLITAFLSIASVVIPAVLAGWEVFAAGISTVISGVQTIFGGLIDFITGVFTGNSYAGEGRFYQRAEYRGRGRAGGGYQLPERRTGEQHCDVDKGRANAGCGKPAGGYRQSSCEAKGH